MSTLLDGVRIGDSPEQFGDEFPADLREEIAPDPSPGKRSGRPGVPKPPNPPKPRPTAAARKRVKDELLVMARMVALGLSVKDEHCGGVLNEQSEAIADALADLVARNAALLEWVHSSGLIGDWLKLAVALWPFVQAIRDHHITGRVRDEQDEGAADDYAAYAPYRPHAA